MNINDFQEYINDTILDRGYGYYIAGNIIEVSKWSDNEYIFQIEGTEDYQVIVNINDNGEILDSSCDCPYDFGPICKHEVAAYFKLDEILNSNDTEKSLIKQEVTLPEIKKVLNPLSKEELMNIILDITKQDATLRNSIIVRYSKEDDANKLKKCKNLIDSIVKKYLAREGFISYRETHYFAQEMENVLENINQTDDIIISLDIAFLLLNEAIEAFQYADDSDGYIGGLVTEIIDKVGEIIDNNKSLEIDLREKLFDKLIEESENEVFYEWEDYKIDILKIGAKFADIEKLRNKLISKIEYMIDKNGNNKNTKYIDENMLMILFDIINLYGTEEEADKFMKNNRKFASFRQLLINKYNQEKNYLKVIELALEGERQDRKYDGLLIKWKEIRYMAYKELSMKSEQKKLAKELLLDGDFNYYKELKELTTEDKKVFYNRLKLELKNKHGCHRKMIYLKIIEEEKDLDEIMEFVRKNPENIGKYASMLVDKFKNEVIEIYKKYIKSEAYHSSNRQEYNEVCTIIRGYKDIAGKENQQEIINELSILYKRKPAFMDELSKIK
ncbi:SWIM zinc finger family protein [Clostridium sp. LCP25S3_F8]|uniref:SWIM zinc finger family protein n=1 Tax=Clostridium sp. LCP25S3_F8 TaxID=3438751 RepID=UPI003F8D9EB3